MTQRLRVGVVGLGWGTRVHVPAFQAVPEYEVAALCARRPEALAAAAGQTGVHDTSTDWETFVTRDDLDLIVVATPVKTHHPIAMAAIEAGKHVLCEKPAALHVAEADALADAAERRGVTAAVSFELRWTPLRYQVWQMARGGYVGDPYFVRISQATNVSHPSHPPQARWMYDLAEGGGYLYGVGPHDLDFVRAAFGEPIAVCADVRAAVSERMIDGERVRIDADDTYALTLRLDSGAVAVLTWCSAAAHGAGEEIEVYGSGGTIKAGGPGLASSKSGREPDRLLAARAEDPGLAPTAVADREPRTRPELAPNRFSSVCIRALALLLEDWLPAFSGEASVVPTLRDGATVQRIVAAARDSSDGAGWVTL